MRPNAALSKRVTTRLQSLKTPAPQEKHYDDCDSDSDNDNNSECPTCKREVVIKKNRNETYDIDVSDSGTTFCLKENIGHDLSRGPAIRIRGAHGVTLKLGGHDITGTGNTGSSSPKPIILVENSREVVITGDRIRGQNGTNSIGLQILNSQKVLLDDVLVTRNNTGISVKNSTEVVLKRVTTDGLDTSLNIENSEVDVTDSYFERAIGLDGNFTFEDTTVFLVEYALGGVFIYNLPGTVGDSPNIVESGRRTVSIRRSTFNNNDVFVVEAGGFVFSDNRSVFVGDEAWIFGVLQLGQSEEKIVGGTTFPQGTAYNFLIENNEFLVVNNGDNTKIIIVNNASSGIIRNNVLINNSKGTAIVSTVRTVTLGVAVSFADEDFVVTDPVGAKILVGHEASSGFASVVANVLIEGNVLSGYQGAELETQLLNVDPSAYGIVIVGEAFCRDGQTANPDFATVSDITVRNNVIGDQTVVGVLVGFATGTVVQDNTIERTLTPGLEARVAFAIEVTTGSIGAIISYNKISNNQGGIDIGASYVLSECSIVTAPPCTSCVQSVTPVGTLVDNNRVTIYRAGSFYTNAYPATNFPGSSSAEFRSAPFFNIEGVAF